MSIVYAKTQSPSPNNPYTSEFLDTFRDKGDPLADALIQTILQERNSRGDLFWWLHQKARTEGGIYQAFMEHVHHPPEWVDFKKMALGAHASLRFALHGGIALLTASLIESYASSKVANILVHTGRLTQDINRRLFETAQFVLEVAKTGGAIPGSEAHRNVVRVRLMHAFVRNAMKRHPQWQEEWGLAFNQEDYAGVLLTFSLVFSRSLQLLGVPLTSEELESIHHTWRYVGYVMGIDESLITKDCADEKELYIALTHRHYTPGEESRRLAHRLLETMAWQQPFFLPPGALFEISRKLIGDTLADQLAFKRFPFFEQRFPLLPKGTSLIHSFQQLPFMRGFAAWFGETLTKGILDFGLMGKSADFE